MNKTLVLAGAVAVGGVAAFIIYKRTSQPPSAGATSPSLISQILTGSGYPFRGSQSVRVDNQSQPWYTGSKAPISGGNGDSQSLKDAAGALGAGSNIVKSMSDIWGNMSDWFGNQDAGDSTDYSSDELLPQGWDSDMWGAGDTADNSQTESSDGVWDDMMSTDTNFEVA